MGIPLVSGATYVCRCEDCRRTGLTTRLHWLPTPEPAVGCQLGITPAKVLCDQCIRARRSKMFATVNVGASSTGVLPGNDSHLVVVA